MNEANSQTYSANDLLEAYLAYHRQHKFVGKPDNLYESMNYIMDLGGKRIRPLLAMACCAANGQDYKKALAFAWCIEAFHNFSLVHDDIMDNADLRRGKNTVHKEFDSNTAILCGDNILVMVFKHLMENCSLDCQLLFAKTASEVCDGQQMDMNFENSASVNISAYIEMIRLKTAVLLGCACKGGALCGGINLADSQLFYDFAIETGLAFQLRDDYLDTFGNSDSTGKAVGGDILAGKKNAPYLLSTAQGNQVEELFSNFIGEERCRQVLALYQSQKIEIELLALITEKEKKAANLLLQISKSGYDIGYLNSLLVLLTDRKS